jgi:hypothetical protein
MKVLFCDLNGTLSVGPDFSRDFVNLSKGPMENMARLKTAIPDLKLVITSDIRFSKRGSTMGRVFSFLDSAGFDYSDILEPTPKHDTRSLEISTWLETKKHISHFAVIDDSWVGHPNTFLVNSDTGLDSATTDKLIAHFQA